MSLKKEKKSAKTDDSKVKKGYNKMLLLFPVIYSFLILSYFGMETNTVSERYTVTSTAVNDSGVNITLSDNIEYASDGNALDSLSTGDEVILTTVSYVRGTTAKTLINNEKVYSSKESRNAETFRTALKYVWTFVNIILALATVMVIFDLLPVMLYKVGFDI